MVRLQYHFSKTEFREKRRTFHRRIESTKFFYSMHINSAILFHTLSKYYLQHLLLSAGNSIFPVPALKFNINHKCRCAASI